MDASFGARLRSQRERQQVALAIIAERTKIKLSLLDGLERDDVSQWPTGIFRRSFVRSYAQAIGLNPDTVLREFLELYPEPPEEDIPAALAAAQDGRRPPTRLGYLIASAISALPAVQMPRGRRRLDIPMGPESTAAAADEIAAVPSGVQVIGAEHRPAEGELPPAPAAMSTAPDLQLPAPDGGEHGARPAEDMPAEELPVAAGADPVEAAVPAEAASAMEASAAPDVFPADAAAATLDRRQADAIDLERDVSAMAALCSRLARAVQPHDVAPVLQDATSILRAVGVILWMWDPRTRTLGHVLAHGYPAEVLARLPRVECGADNAIADAFRSGESRVVRGSALATGAVVVPLVTAAGCVGALALELQDRNEEREPVRALATILAAQLAAVVHVPPVIEVATA